MKKNTTILQHLFSMQLLGIAFLAFAFSMGIATFIEHKYGTNAAKALVYDASWFFALLAYGGATLLYNTFRFKLFSKNKIGVLLFHLSFIVIIIGAGITRFTAVEGNISIREQDSNNKIYSFSEFVQIKQNNTPLTLPKQVLFSVLTPRAYKKKISVDNSRISIKSVAYVENDQHGKLAQFEVSDGTHTQNVWVPFGSGLQMPAKTVTLGDKSIDILYCKQVYTLPYRLYLDDFIFDKYPGSQNPMAYKSLVTIKDEKAKEENQFLIEMNHVLDYKGYRFFQSSYDNDEKGTILTVNRDKLGTNTTYFGYFLLMLGMVWALMDKKSRFRYFLKLSKSKVLLALMLLGTLTTFSQEKAQAIQHSFDNLWVQGVNERFQPMSVFADEVIRKVHKKRTIDGKNGSEVIFGMLANPMTYLQKEIIATPNHPLLQKYNINEGHSSFLSFYDLETRQYILLSEIQRIYALAPNARSKSDKELLNLDERINIFRMIVGGNLPLLLPNKADLKGKWISLSDFIAANDSITQEKVNGILSSNEEKQLASIQFISEYQALHGAEVLPSAFKQDLEQWYYNANIFERLAAFYGLMSFVLFTLIFLSIFSKWEKGFKKSVNVATFLLFIGFIFHTIGLTARGLISGHMPLSNGYESVVFVAWASLLAGFIFFRRNPFLPAMGALMAAFAMLVSHMSFMNPQITQLVPVLRSYWLTIHVTLITSSYGFLGAGFIIAYFNLILMLFISGNGSASIKLQRVIKSLYPYAQIASTIGLYLLTIGCFLGAIWANQSWGRYWSWDPKETWCLISIIVYSFIMHMHHFPGFSDIHTLLSGLVLGFASILMTYFGVNYFLGGMHSYAGEGNVSLSANWYIGIGITLLVIALSAWKSKKHNLDSMLKKCENF